MKQIGIQDRIHASRGDFLVWMTCSELCWVELCQSIRYFCSQISNVYVLRNVFKPIQCIILICTRSGDTVSLILHRLQNIVHRNLKRLAFLSSFFFTSSVKGVPSAESSRSVRRLGKGVSGKPYPRLCNAKRPRLKLETFRSQTVRLYRLHQARTSSVKEKNSGFFFMLVGLTSSVFCNRVELSYWSLET